MTDPRKEPYSAEDEAESDFGSRLKVRLLIAGALVALALAAIPLLDHLTGKKSEPSDSGNSIASLDSSAAVAAVPDSSAATASAPAASASAPVASPAGAPTGPDLSQTPGMSAATPLTLPAATPAQAPTPMQTHTPSAQHHQTHSAPEPVAPHQASKAYKPGYTPAPSYNAAVPAPIAPPAAQTQPQPQASLPARPVGSSVGYNVQLGLFSNLENAQKLIAELKSKGIEVQSETRVHLAPFRTRAEAEQAIAKLRAMGYAPMLGAMGN